MRPLAAGRPVRRGPPDRTRRQGPAELAQVVVGPVLVEVPDVEADHDRAHAEGSAHIGFV